jgi:hypothetical protein
MEEGGAIEGGAVQVQAAQPWAADAEELIECARYGELDEAEALLAAHAGLGAAFVNFRNEWGQSG